MEKLTRRRRKAAFYNYISPRCVICAEEHPLLLDFHHFRGKKTAKISTLLYKAIDAPHVHCAALEAELQNVVPLCVVCHRLLHAGEITLRGDELDGIYVDNLQEVLYGAN